MTYQRRNNNRGFNYHTIQQIVIDAVSPVATDLKSLRDEVAQQRLNGALKTETYSREYTDQMMKGIRDEIAEIRSSAKDNREMFWKVIAGGVSILGALVLIAQHIRIY